MNDYKEIRKRFLNGESQRHIAKTLGISRNTVAKYCNGSSVPWERKTPVRESTILTDDVTDFILACLKEDQSVPFKKQHHTAKRIYDRLVSEKGFTGGESTIRRKVRELRGKMPKAFIPLQFDPGEALQIDWGEADIYLNTKKERINLFCSRLCYSCRPVVLAYHRQNTESLIDALVTTFNTLGGTTSRVIFDNSRVAVKSGFSSHARMQDSYAALSAHYGFDAVFCNPAEGHEKGLVEGLVGWARRNICVPIPRVSDIQELNRLLMERCKQYENHTVKNRKASVGELFLEEKEHLHPLPVRTFETASCMEARVNAFSLVRFCTNSYSVPVRYVGCPVSIKGYPETVEIYYKGSQISLHNRLFGRHRVSYHLEDYLPLLEQRPRAVFDAAPVKQNIPYEVLQELREAHSSKDNVISILQLYAQKDPVVIRDPVTVKAVDLHPYDALCIGREVTAHD